jgi:hypothetical protein
MRVLRLLVDDPFGLDEQEEPRFSPHLAAGLLPLPPSASRSPDGGAGGRPRPSEAALLRGGLRRESRQGERGRGVLCPTRAAHTPRRRALFPSPRVEARHGGQRGGEAPGRRGGLRGCRERVQRRSIIAPRRTRQRPAAVLEQECFDAAIFDAAITVPT